jgi:hypothetical protein
MFNPQEAKGKAGISPQKLHWYSTVRAFQIEKVLKKKTPVSLASKVAKYITFEKI